MLIVGSGRRGRFLRFRSLGALVVPCVGVVGFVQAPPYWLEGRSFGVRGKSGVCVCVCGKGSVCFWPAVCDSLLACATVPSHRISPSHLLCGAFFFTDRENSPLSSFLTLTLSFSFSFSLRSWTMVENFIRPHPRTQNLYTSSCIRSGPRVSCWAPSCTLALETFFAPHPFLSLLSLYSSRSVNLSLSLSLSLF